MNGDGRSVTRKLIEAHLVAGRPYPGNEIGLHIDQTLTQDATGTLVMLVLEAIGLDTVRTEVSAQYVDHNLLQEDHRNADDHQFLLSAARRFGIHYSRPGNGVSHPLHMQHFGRPGATLLGSDSHTCAAGSLGMLAIGAGGMEVALAMGGEPYYLPMPEIWGVELVGSLPAWVSAKDVILEMLRRHGVRGGVGRVIEYFGPGLAGLTAMDRHVIANMGAELGATSTVFPSDQQTRHFLARSGRKGDWAELTADRDACYDHRARLDLSTLEPLIATPSSPGNVVPVREVAGEPIYQAYVGSSANPGFRDFAIVARIVAGRTVPPEVSLDITPTSRELLEELARAGLLVDLLEAGARIHQPGCGGCIGMGQAPATGRNSLRTVPRNFPGRSGAREDRVFLCSPETAAASALRGVITDPRDLGDSPPRLHWDSPIDPPEPLVAPPALEDRAGVTLVKGPDIASLTVAEPVPDRLEVPVLLVLGNDVSTDEIMPAGSRVLPLRSNLPATSAFVFRDLDESYAERARRAPAHAVVAGTNYGQGSSREHAALAPRFLGLSVVVARSYARIHRQNLINAGILPLSFADGDAAARLARGDTLTLSGIHTLLASADRTRAHVDVEGGWSFEARVEMSARERAIIRAGGLLGWYRATHR